MGNGNNLSILRGLLVLAPLIFGSSQAVAQISDCNQLIALSRNTTQTVSNQTQFESYERRFCNAYSQSKSSGKTMSAGASYGPISANYGQSSSSMESTASMYCEDDGSIKQGSNLFNDYINVVAPGAFQAYNNCIALEHKDITFSFSDATMRPTYAVFTVSDVDGNPLDSDSIAFVASPGINCNWRGAAPSQVSHVVHGSGAEDLICQRRTSDTDGFVKLTAQHTPTAQVAIPWPQYINGAPIGVAQQYEQATQDAHALSMSMSGAVVPFDSSSCPVGWSLYTPAEGRFIRGITTTGDKGLDPDGQRPPGNTQDDDLKSHTHAMPRVVWDAGGVYGHHGSDGALGYSFTNPPVTGPTGGSETRPKNVALLYCRHD